MNIETLLQLYREGKICIGDEVTAFGCLADVGLRKNVVPFYFFEQEKYCYRFYHHIKDILHKDKDYFEYFQDKLASYLEDEKGYYFNNVFLLFPRYKIEEALPDKKNPCVLHLIPFGIKHLIVPPSVTGCDEKGEYGCDEPYEMYRVTGELMVPKNVSECGIELGIGNLKELCIVNMDNPCEVYHSLNMTVYNPRPLIDFSWLSIESREARVLKFLLENNKDRSDFNFSLNDDIDTYESGYSPLSFWSGYGYE